MGKSNSGLENDETEMDGYNQGRTASVEAPEKDSAVTGVRYLTAWMGFLFDREKSCYIKYFTHPLPSFLMKVVYSMV